MKETSIIMSGDHPRKILDGIKTMTRRLNGLAKINQETDRWKFMSVSANHWYGFRDKDTGKIEPVKSPYGGIGDMLWVRETFHNMGGQPTVATIPVIIYRADFLREPLDRTDAQNLRELLAVKYTASIHMHKYESRIRMSINELRAERLRDISPEDALAEGGYTVEEFINLFLKINHLPKDANPWNWVIGWPKFSK
jgi:hypothetical protein